MPKEVMSGDYDIVFAEMGILHYFSDLSPFMNVIHSLLKDGGKAVLRDFHPVSTKLITSRGSTAKVRKHKVTGDYFDTSLEEKEVAYSKYLEKGEVEKVFLGKADNVVYNDNGSVTILPNKYMDGFFIAKLKKKESK